MYSEKLSLPEFDRVTLKGLGNVYLSAGKEQSFSIGSNQDLSNKIKTEVFNRELIISFHDILPVWLVTIPKLDFHITMKSFTGCRVTGVGKIMSKGTIVCDNAEIVNTGVGGIHLQLKAGHVKGTLSGVGEVSLMGETDKLDLELSGTGKVDAYNLAAREATVSSRGIGECVVNVAESLKVHSSGIGNIKYKGSPKLESTQGGLGGIKNIM
jgi:hypothetical protein